MIVVKIGAVKAVICLWAQMNLFPYILYLLYVFGVIWLKRTTRNAV